MLISLEVHYHFFLTPRHSHLQIVSSKILQTKNPLPVQALMSWGNAFGSMHV